jgi:hypothetical protein
MTAHLLFVILIAILKVALLAFIVGGVAAIIIRGRRRSRANRGDPNWMPRGQPSHEASAHGAMPSTPLPEWVYWNDENGDDDDPRRSS